MTIDERALAFDCGGDRLVGILALPAQSPPKVQVQGRGVLVVVGGPQYRAGSHRQFTLLARDLAADGVPTMRFDYRGMGDSAGDMRSFETVADDLRAAVDAFMAAVPGLREVVLWGLCDGASVIAMHAADDARVAGVVLLNPWVRSEQGIARATLRHYYRARLLDAAFWRKLLGGRFDVAGSLGSMLGLARAARGGQDGVTEQQAPFPVRMRTGLRAFAGPVLVITSGADLTAREFCDLAGADREWKRLLAAPRVTRRELDKADHTFSRRAWRDQVSRWTREWLQAW